MAAHKDGSGTAVIRPFSETITSKECPCTSLIVIFSPTAERTIVVSSPNISARSYVAPLSSSENTTSSPPIFKVELSSSETPLPSKTDKTPRSI